MAFFVAEETGNWNKRKRGVNTCLSMSLASVPTSDFKPFSYFQHYKTEIRFLRGTVVE